MAPNGAGYRGPPVQDMSPISIARPKLTTLSIHDTAIRTAIFSGMSVERWSEVALPPGVVVDGLIAKAEEFGGYFAEAMSAVNAGGKHLNNRRVAVSFGGRNVVQRTLIISIRPGQTAIQAVREASADGLGVSADELELDWCYSKADGKRATDSSRWYKRSHNQVVRKQIDSEVYVLGLQKSVVSDNLRAISSTGLKIGALQPKALAIAAAVNEAACVVVDIEANRLMVLVLRDGLPEVIREVPIEPGMTKDGAALFVMSQVSKSVAYYNSLYPDSSISAGAPLFITGSDEATAGYGRKALAQLPYVITEVPQLMKAPKDFSHSAFAGNIGLALVSGNVTRAFGSAGSVMSRPTLNFVPALLAARPSPAKPLMAAAAVLGLTATGYALIVTSMDAQAAVDRVRAETRESQLDAALRKAQVTQYLTELRQAEAVSAAATDIRKTTERIVNVDGGISDVLGRVISALPINVSVVDFSGDTKSATFVAAAPVEADLFDLARALDSDTTFQDVVVRSLYGVAEGEPPTDGKEPIAMLAITSFRMQIEVVKAPVAVQ